MDFSCGVSFSVKRISDPHARNVLWALGATLASTVIIFASLGSIQNQCRNEDPSLLSGVAGFSGDVLGCKKLYRYYWFITVLSFVTASYSVWTTARGLLASSRGAVLGLLVIANLLTINMTDAFLSAVDVVKFQDGPARDRVRTMIAGCIITAFFQAVSVILVGYDPNAAPAAECCTPAVCKAAPAPEATAVELATAPQPAAQPTAAPEAPAPAAEPAPADVEAPAAPAEAEPAAAPEAPAPEGESAVAVAVQ